MTEAPAWQTVFEHSPYGLVVGSPSGRLLAANLKARALLRGPAEVGTDSTCCQTFGCRRADGPLAAGCLTELAREAGGDPLPEIRVDIDNGGAGAAWVTASASPDASVIYHLRPGERGDRRRRTEPHWLAGPTLHVHTFGKLRVSSGDVAIGGQWLEHRPGHILKYLVSNRGRAVPADELAEAFWPEGMAAGLANVRHFIHHLRNHLEPRRASRTPSSFVLSRSGGYMLDRNRVRIDADAFEASAQAGLEAVAAGEAEAALGELRAAMALYEGEFIADEPYAEWVLAERDRLHDLASTSVRALAELAAERGDLAGETRAVRKLADLNPFDSGVQRELLVLILAGGRRTEAVRRYNGVRARLMRQFGEGPGFELADLGAEAAAKSGAAAVG